MSLFSELKRRNVFRVAAAYVVVGWLLTEVSTTLLDTFGAPDWVAKAIILVLAIGFVPILIFSWAFELTPEGIKRERDVDRDTSITSRTGRKLDYVTIAAVVVGIAFLAFLKDRPQVETPQEITATEPADASVAVLPFVNMSGNAENEYFSDGLTETLLHMLAQVPELKVAARTSSFAFKGQDRDIREIATALDVAHILEGSVQRAGDRVRITAQLIRANDGFHVWSENYDRTLNDIFAIQDEIAGRVGDALSASLLGEAEPAIIVGVGTENIRAYDLYLMALSENAKGSYGSLKAAEGHLKDALSLDPGFHEAKSELAHGLIRQLETGLRDPGQARQEASALLDQVLAEYPDDVRARAESLYIEVMDGAYFGRTEEMDNALAMLFEHADANRTHVETQLAAATIASRFLQSQEAIDRLVAASGVDPLNPQIFYQMIQPYTDLDMWDSALAAGRRSLELEPLQPNVYSRIADVFWEKGDLVGFLDSYIKSSEIDTKDQELPAEIARALYQLRLVEEGDEYRNRVLAIAPTSPVAYMVNVYRAEALGDFKLADEIARSAIVDDIQERQSSYFKAFQVVTDTAVAQGTTDELLEFVAEHAPLVFANHEEEVPFRFRIARWPMLSVWAVRESPDAVIERVVEQGDYARRFGFNIEEDAFSQAFLAAIRGDDAAATKALLDGYFSEPVVHHLEFRNTFVHPVFQGVRSDPAYQAAFAEFEREWGVLRSEVQTFLATRKSPATSR